MNVSGMLANGKLAKAIACIGIMATITIRNISDELIARIKPLAAQNGVSMDKAQALTCQFAILRNNGSDIAISR
ncbi:MAG: FitA-like ribbon-helix-helix domain-containing protein [Cuspidothrix sp.]